LSHFEFLTVGLSFVLGLAVTVLLTSLLAVFRARHSTRMSWLSLVWAFYILVLQFDVWWEAYGLATLENWSPASFSILLALALLLFAAGGLILPSASADYPQDLATYFDEDGRWAVGLVGLFALVGIVANVLLFGVPPSHPVNLLNAGVMLLCFLVVFVTHTFVRATLTLFYGVFLAFYLYFFVADFA
jgi:hypothetical protein